jgi:hypothetical protein
MWIQFVNAHTQRFHDDEVMPDGYVVEPNADGVAQVTEDAGEALVMKYESINLYDVEGS